MLQARVRKTRHLARKYPSGGRPICVLTWHPRQFSSASNLVPAGSQTQNQQSSLCDSLAPADAKRLPAALHYSPFGRLYRDSSSEQAFPISHQQACAPAQSIGHIAEPQEPIGDSVDYAIWPGDTLTSSCLFWSCYLRH